MFRNTRRSKPAVERTPKYSGSAQSAPRGDIPNECGPMGNRLSRNVRNARLREASHVMPPAEGRDKHTTTRRLFGIDTKLTLGYARRGDAAWFRLCPTGFRKCCRAIKRGKVESVNTWLQSHSQVPVQAGPARPSCPCTGAAGRRIKMLPREILRQQVAYIYIGHAVASMLTAIDSLLNRGSTRQRCERRWVVVEEGNPVSRTYSVPPRLLHAYIRVFNTKIKCAREI